MFWSIMGAALIRTKDISFGVSVQLPAFLQEVIWSIPLPSLKSRERVFFHLEHLLGWKSFSKPESFLL